jgi:hypothetical protein
MSGAYLLKEAAQEALLMHKVAANVNEINRMAQQGAKTGLIPRIAGLAWRHPILSLGAGAATYGAGRLGLNAYRYKKQQQAMYGLR